jgi:hypothetical protein
VALAVETDRALRCTHHRERDDLSAKLSAQLAAGVGEGHSGGLTPRLISPARHGHCPGAAGSDERSQRGQQQVQTTARAAVVW